MKIKEFEKKLQNTAGDSTKAKIHVEEEKKDAFRVLSHDTSGLKLISSYAGTVRVNICCFHSFHRERTVLIVGI